MKTIYIVRSPSQSAPHPDPLPIGWGEGESPPKFRLRSIISVSQHTLVMCGLTALLMGGCAAPSRHPVPKEAASMAHLPGFDEDRVVLDPRSTNAVRDLAGLMKGFEASGGADHHLHLLALSGGGENGAYGAGLLCGWTEAGTRPQFDIVTGISTGSLIAPLAFLGNEFDPQLRHGYTEIKPSQVFLKRGFFGILKHRDAVADSKPLQELIAETIGENELAAIAREHQKGRRLLVMTTDLDAQKPVIWDIGAIAASGRPEALKLIHKVLLASASIPVAFPPVLFDVEVNQQHYDELHVDGGVMAQVFGGFLLPVVTPVLKAGTPVDFYLIRNGRLGAEYSAPERKISAIAGRSISTLMKVQGGSDVLRAWMFSRATGSSFHFISMPEEFQTELKEPFDPEYMKALFDVVHQQGRNGIPWQQTPPGLQDAEMSQAPGAR